MNLFVSVVLILLSATSLAQLPADDRTDIWPTIPFARGADLCRYKDAYGQTRSDYVAKMSRLAMDLMYTGGLSGRDAFILLSNFTQLYDQNLQLATQHQYLDVTLESTLKAYIDGYYRDLRPKIQKIIFTSRDEYLDHTLLKKLDYFAYGTYALAPNCAGDIQVTLHLIGRSGTVKSYIGEGPLSVVMSRIAAKMFEDFQRTQFPSKIKVGAKNLTLIGGMNGSVDIAASPLIAKHSCETLNARLPSEFELEILNAYGDWSGGISLNQSYWALPSGKVFAPMLRNPSPVRETWEVNAADYNYYCVQD